MALRLGSIVLNVTDTRRAGAFWSDALGYAPGENPDFLAGSGGEGSPRRHPLFCVIDTSAP